MKTKQIMYLSIVALAMTFTSCKKDKPEEPADSTTTPVTTTPEGGVFITNEGPFGSGTGTVSYYNRGTKVVSNDIFGNRNGFPLGNIVQSMSVFNGKGYIVVNNASKVEVIDASTIESKGVITGLTNPRYFLGISSDKGYISEWGVGGIAGAIKVVDLNTQMVTSTISTGKGAEGMVKVGNNVYVTCSGGFDKDSVVTVINASTNAIVKTINVGTNPKGIQVDANGKVWVLCTGQWDLSFTTLLQTGKLVRIDASADTVDLSITFTSTTAQPSNLVINKEKNTLYYSYQGKVYSHSNMASTLNSTSIINRDFYGLGIDPTNNYFYGSDAGDYASNGKVIRYNAAGVVVDTLTVGVIPGNFFFK